MLCAEDLLYGEARHRVEEEDEEDSEAEEGEQLQDGPFVIVPNDVTDALERVKEPHEGSIWPAVERKREEVRGKEKEVRGKEKEVRGKEESERKRK